ncbi:kynurenine 3-monooxygenase [Ophiobolus disseminans]|uniref:Kynurenine 3-monooxygenase n=1 Tax=Ophiobolus disseminans TaxID=1469910 RepID=A0A6A6ZKQ6_9PLEO|nr:kynurenine 3-monooxygenase [Ophiobolus disseminans]
MMSTPPKSVAIIGAGLSGLTLAISLHRQNISCQIYELRDPSITTSGALMLSPNALRILDNLGLYDRLKPQGYNFESIAYNNHEQVTTDTYLLGHEKLYGYKALRIYRQTLLTELRAEAQRLNISITYGVKFSHVVSEEHDGVSFAFTNNQRAFADVLVGADGIHSTVRKYVAPNVVPKYSGMVAITCAIPREALSLPTPDFHLPVAISGPNGAFVMAPQNAHGTEILAGTQRAYPEQDRAGWDALLADRTGLLELFRTGYEDWDAVSQSALDNVDLSTLAIWPYYVVPKLPSWTSTTGRVLILGDAAHAIPPTAGQGASQGFEDAFTLSHLLPHITPKFLLSRALNDWTAMRQSRIDRVVALTLQLNNARLPAAEREKMAARGEVWMSGEQGELEWLYGADGEADVRGLVGGKEAGKKEKITCPVDWVMSKFSGVAERSGGTSLRVLG